MPSFRDNKELNSVQRYPRDGPSVQVLNTRRLAEIFPGSFMSSLRVKNIRWLSIFAFMADVPNLDRQGSANSQ